MKISELLKGRRYPPDSANRIRSKLGLQEWSDEKIKAAIESSLSLEEELSKFAIPENGNRSGSDIKKETIIRSKTKDLDADFGVPFNPQPKGTK